MRSRTALLSAAGAVVLAAVLVTGAQAAPAPPEPAPPVQGERSTFPEGAPFTVTNDATALCLSGKAPVSGEREGAVVVEACDEGADQEWTYDVVSKRLRNEKLGVRWCLSAEGPAMVRCPDVRSDTYRWLQKDGIYTPGNGDPRYLGVQAGPGGAHQVLTAAAHAAGTGFDWTVESTQKPPPVTNTASSPEPTRADEPAPAAPAGGPLPVGPPNPGALPVPPLPVP